ncbi:hypothetical protein UMM65_07040 [Aureibaculum sp. 2210JD6-5]|nr:hypothetical protein [Aureibaculum sp. 2210JD6-5]MDY7394991.1 hypothetical protein [Aureibaculum sp. 2210JD6-5]
MKNRSSSLKQFARVGKIFPKEIVNTVHNKSTVLSGSANFSKNLDK